MTSRLFHWQVTQDRLDRQLPPIWLRRQAASLGQRESERRQCARILGRLRSPTHARRQGRKSTRGSSDRLAEVQRRQTPVGNGDSLLAMTSPLAEQLVAVTAAAAADAMQPKQQ